MSSFQALMALSASQTKESQGAVQIALRERQKKEAAKRKEQEEKDKKDREQERKMRLMHFEEQKREVEKQKREEEKRKALEATLQRREDEQRNALLYGPKKSGKYPTSTSGIKESVRKSRLPSDDAADGEPTPGSFLTREELRQRKHMAEQRRLYASSRRSSGNGSYSKQGRRLPGGAVDITTNGARGADEGAFKSVKDRLAAQPITLTKLNVVKRDTRTIDEIVQDRAKAKILDGDKAREFSDWFGSSKKKELVKGASPSATPMSTPSTTTTPAASQSATSTVASGANTPLSQRGTPGPNGASASATAAKKAPAQPTKSAAASAPSKSSYISNHSASSSTAKSHAQQSLLSRASSVNGKPTKSSLPSSFQPPVKSHSSLSTAPKKRPRSESRSESPPSKRRGSYVDEEEAEVPGNISSMIWNMFGRNRDNYVGMNVFSDDEDMEADADAVAREEARSARLAALEDQKALEEERRHEEEKRRRKKERDARAMSSR
ncbi:SPT2 chromatin domain containing protein [Amanita muscaria]